MFMLVDEEMNKKKNCHQQKLHISYETYLCKSIGSADATQNLFFGLYFILKGFTSSFFLCVFLVISLSFKLG